MGTSLLQKSMKPSVFESFTVSYALVGIFVALLFLQKSKILLLWFKKVKSGKTKNYDYYEDLPGPPHLPILGVLHHLRDIRQTIDVFRYFGNECGPVIKFHLFNLKFVILNNAPMAHILLASTDPGHLKKASFLYDLAFSKLLANGILTTNDLPHWKSHRKLLSSSFSLKSFQNYSKIFGRCAKKLVSNLEEMFATTGEYETRQINSCIHHCSLQSISEAVMGLKLCLDDEGKLFYDCVRRAKDVFGFRVHKPYLMLDFFWKFHPLSREYDRAVNTIHSIVKKMIEQHKEAKEASKLKEENQNKSNLNDELIAEHCLNGKTMIEEMLKNDMNETDVMHEVCTIIFAGFETSGAAVHYLMFLLALNQDHQKRCQEEVDLMFSDPMKCIDGQLTYEGISDLKYLERCLNESLRLFPPVLVSLRELDTPLKLSETLVIPPGINVGIPQLTLNKNPEYFPNPEAFIPDRHLPENVANRPNGAFVPFSSGLRNCIGAKFAVVMAKTMAAHIIRNFDVYTTDTVEDVKLLPSIFLTPERDYNFILKKRMKE